MAGPPFTKNWREEHMKLGLVQMSMTNDLAANLEKSLKYCDLSKVCDLVFFPEIQLTPFFPQYEKQCVDDYCIDIDDIAIQKFSEKTLVIVPTANTKAEPMEIFEWEMRVQAMQNQVFIAMCNRVGTEGEMEFAGESLVIAPNGNVIIKADDTEQLLICDIDFQEVKTARKKQDYLSLRRPEQYIG